MSKAVQSPSSMHALCGMAADVRATTITITFIMTTGRRDGSG
jgi:hypothetical protein